jgi:hypothetical protein
VNRKRIERLWRLEGHRVPPRRSQASGKKAQGTAGSAVWNLPASAPNHVWSYDFMSGRTRDGASLRILNVVEEHTRVALGSRVDRSIGASDVIDELARPFAAAGRSERLRRSRPVQQRRSEWDLPKVWRGYVPRLHGASYEAWSDLLGNAYKGRRSPGRTTQVRELGRLHSQSPPDKGDGAQARRQFRDP